LAGSHIDIIVNEQDRDHLASWRAPDVVKEPDRRRQSADAGAAGHDKFGEAL
jgi:hypothetical protein